MKEVIRCEIIEDVCPRKEGEIGSCLTCQHAKTYQQEVFGELGVTGRVDTRRLRGGKGVRSVGTQHLENGGKITWQLTIKNGTKEIKKV